MKNRRWQNIAFGLAFALPVLGVYVGRKLLSKAKNKSAGILPEVTRIKIPLSSLIGISDSEEAIQPQQSTIILPETPAVIENQEDETSAEAVQIEYIASAERGVFHIMDCRWAKNIKSDNIIHLDTRKDAVDRGYTPCNTCNP